jgi:hypothetical protein
LYIYYTKYALTTGISTHHVKQNGKTIEIEGLNGKFETKYIHSDLDRALQNAENMRLAKISKMEMRLRQLKSMKIAVKDAQPSCLDDIQIDTNESAN